MSIFPVLPKEIWRTILLSHPGVYFTMVQCSKEFAIPTEFMQYHFTKQVQFKSGLSVYCLPNGLLHDYGNKPAITLSDGTELGCKYGKVPDLPHRAFTETLTLHNIEIFDIRIGIEYAKQLFDNVINEDVLNQLNSADTLASNITTLEVEECYSLVYKQRRRFSVQECECTIL